MKWIVVYDFNGDEEWEIYDSSEEMQKDMNALINHYHNVSDLEIFKAEKVEHEKVIKLKKK